MANYLLRKKGSKEFILKNNQIEDVIFENQIVGWQVGEHYFPARIMDSYTQAQRCAAGLKFHSTCNY